MDFSTRTLTPLQREVLELLKDVPSGYLSGGVALGGYLGHRMSFDVDLFLGRADELEMAGAMLEAGAASRGWRLTQVTRYPGFRRYQVNDGNQSTLVDLVHEPVPQIVGLQDKPLANGVRVDSLDDLVANKLCAVLGRSEVKDLVDLYFLAQSGIDVPAHLKDSQIKDGGMEPTTLAFVLTQMPTDPTGLLLLHPLDPTELAAFRDMLVEHLLRLSWPVQ